MGFRNGEMPALQVIILVRPSFICTVLWVPKRGLPACLVWQRVLKLRLGSVVLDGLTGEWHNAFVIPSGTGDFPGHVDIYRIEVVGFAQCLKLAISEGCFKC